MTSVSDKPSIDVPTFIEAVRRSALLKVEDLKRSLKSVALTTDDATRTAKDVADHLVAAEQITAWQAGQLLRGKYRGFRIGSYILRRPIGKGGMGVVFEAQHVVLGTRVAIKFLPKGKSESDKSVSRFLAEARAAAKLAHPNIVRVHDCNVAGNRLFMVMDLVEGSNLSDIVRRKGPLSYFAAITLLKQAASGLAYAHEAGITHRDVKPANFLVDKDGQLKVADLGLALFEIDSPDRYTQDGGAVLGTVDYLAPEQAWDSTKVDRRADIYALGCTLYFMLAGKAPFDQGTLAQRLAQHQTANPTPLNQIRKDCPPFVWELCQKMLAKRPQHRIQKMSEVEAACNQLLPSLSSGNIASITDGVTPLVPQKDQAVSFDGGLLNADSGSGGGSADGFGVGLPPSAASSGPVDFGSISMDTQPSGASMANTMPMAADVPQDQWAQPMALPATNPYATPKSSAKKSKTDSKTLYTRIGVAFGLVLALTALGMSIVSFLTEPSEDDRMKPMIKTVETDDGTQVIIVDEQS